MPAWGLIRVLSLKFMRPLLFTGGGAFVLISVYGIGALNARTQCKAAQLLAQSRQDVSSINQTIERRRAASAYAIEAARRLQPKRDRVITQRERIKKHQSENTERQNKDRKNYAQIQNPHDIVLDKHAIDRLYLSYTEIFAE